MFFAELDGADDLMRAVVREEASLKRDLANANLAAAQQGIQNVKDSHPYTDRTGRLTDKATAVRVAAREDLLGAQGNDLAEMRWPMRYAKFVNEKERFNFTKQAEERAALVLEYGTEVALDRFAEKLSD